MSLTSRAEIASARIFRLREVGGYGWITARRAPQIAAVTAGRLRGADTIGLRVGRTIGRPTMARHFTLAEPTDIRRRAFQLLDVPIPITLT